jgi:glutathione S-transferase
MTLILYYHPLSSFCQKVLIGLYELDIPFQKQLVDLMDPAGRAAFLKVWPLGKFPVLRDAARDLTIPETSIILEYLDEQHTRPERLIPRIEPLARSCRLRDRFFDLHVNVPMGKIVTDKLRPEGKHDTHGVDEARRQLETAYAIADDWLRAGPYALGEAFSMADCAAAPALFYANQVQPFAQHRQLSAYFARLEQRPSYARVLEESRPYLSMFPG